MSAPAMAVVSATGMAVDLSGPTEDLIVAADDITEAIYELRSAKAAITSVVAARMDKANSRQERFGKFEVRVNAPKERAWDIEALRVGLWALVAEGALEAEVVEKVIVPDGRFKVRAVEARKLRAHSDERVARVVKDAGPEVDAERRLTIKLATGE